MRKPIAMLLCWALAVVAPTAWGQFQTRLQTQTPSAVLPNPLVVAPSDLSLSVSGTVSFGLRYGLGDGRGLALKGYSQGLQFNQLIALNLAGDVPATIPLLDLPGVFSISAQLNSQQADNLQELAMHFQSERLVMDLGDFVVGENAPDFIVPDRKLKGFKAVGLLDDLTVTGAFARIEGIAENKTFRGNTSTESTLFSDKLADRPWLDQPYLRNLEGLEFFALDGGFVDGFSKVLLNLHAEGDLDTLLGNYALGYLLAQLRQDGPVELDEGRFQIVRADERPYLVLLREARDLLRDLLREAIDKYNLDQGLLGEARKEYPFNEDTELELGFLQALQARATLDVDAAQLPLGAYQRQRFFFLGRRQIDPDSLKVEVLSNGQFIDVNDPQLFDYEVRLHAEQGIAEFLFPASFFEDKSSQMRATFNYTSTSGVYILGLSIVKGSDRVLLNGQPLAREMDYTIDYETGALILFRQVTRDDVLRIEYEVLRGGLGGFTEYQRNLSQLSFEFSPIPWLAMNVDLFQGADVGGGDDRQRLRTMPNTHTVAGLRAKADLGPLQAGLVLGYNVNAYPLDDNLRQNLPNRINDIATLDYGGRQYVLFAHQNGLTVYDGVRWASYDTRSGLSGRSVYGVVTSPDWVALATESGLTLVRLEGDDPFALIPNWLRFYQQDGPASNEVLAVDFEGNTLWLGTSEGLTQVNADPGLRRFEDPKNWISYLPERHPEMLDGRITQLAAAGGRVYLGTPQGLQVFDPADKVFATDLALRGAPVHDLAKAGRSVYVASQWGVRLMRDGRGSGWLESAQPAYAVAALGDGVWYAPESGLRLIGPGTVPRELRALTVRALGVAGSALWVGPVIDEPDANPLTLYRARSGEAEAFGEATTRINGRDLSRFADIALPEHLDLGGLGALQLTYRVGTLELTGALEGKAKGFSPIGGASRDEYLRWRLRGDYALLPKLTLYAEHVSSLMQAQITDRLGFGFNDGMNLSVDYTEEQLPERQEARARFALSLSDAFLNDALDVRFRLDDEGTRSLRRDRRTQDLTLSSSVGWQATNVLRLDLSANSPLHLRTDSEPRGSVQLGGKLLWTPQLELGSLSVTLEHETGQRFPFGGGSRQDGLDASMVWQSFQWNGVTLIPRSSLELGQRGEAGTGQLLSLSLSNLVQARWERLSAQARWNREQLFSTLNQTQSVQDTLGVRLDYGGWENLSPGLDWTWMVNELSHVLRPSKRSTTHQLGAHVGWKPQPALNLSVSTSLDLADTEDEQSARWGLQGNGSYRLLEGVDLTLAASGDWARGQRGETPFDTTNLDATLGADWRFAEDWVAQFSLGLIHGTDARDPSLNHLSYVASAQASLTF